MPVSAIQHTLTQLGIDPCRARPLQDALATGTMATLPWVSSVETEIVGVGTLIDERYEVESLIGRGSFGAVYLVMDQATEEQVALKVLTRAAPHLVTRMHQEISVLRRLDLPGVVGFLDEGMLDGRPYIVMPVLTGVPFPGPVADRGWETLGSRLVALAESIARIHGVGVLHRDLKPDNVLWVGEQSMLLDFGLAVSDKLAIDEDGLTGTPAYMSPEQYFGEEPDERSDLFALGAIAYEALAGRRAFNGDTLFEVVASVLQDVPPALCSMTDIPQPVGEMIDALLSKDRDARPRFAEEVVQVLVQAMGTVDCVVDADAPESDALEALFVGPELVHHLRSDPARVLWARTGGGQVATSRTLRSWERAGVCREVSGGWSVQRGMADRLLAGMPVDPCRGWDAVLPELSGVQRTLWIVVDRLAPWASVERLATLVVLPVERVVEQLHLLAQAGVVAEVDSRWTATRSPPRASRTEAMTVHRVAARLVPKTANSRVGHLVSCGDLEAVPSACLEVGRARISEGLFAPAWQVIREGIVVERRMGAQGPELAHLAAEVALAGNAPAWLSVVALEARRRGLSAVVALVEAARSALRGQIDTAALEELEGLPEALDLWRLRLMAYAFARRSLEDHEDWLQSVRQKVEAMAGGSLIWEGWHARLLHRRGRSIEAAELNEASLDRTGDHHHWSSIALNTVGMWNEAGRFDRAEALLAFVEPHVDRQRVPAHEAYGRHLRRSIRYRRGEMVLADEEFVEALLVLDAPMFVAPMLLLDGAAAWRRGELDVALQRVGLAVKTWDVANRQVFWALARSFEALLGGEPLTTAEVARFRLAFEGFAIPGIVVQMSAILCRHGTHMLRPSSSVQELLPESEYPSFARREILSRDEMHRWLGGYE